MTDTSPLFREPYKGISLYSPNRAPARIDLSDNTNLWGVPPKAAEAIRNASTATVIRYPSLYANTIKDVVGDYLGVSREMVVTGCGSDDVLDSIFRAFGNTGDSVVYPTPSFPMIPIFSQMNGLNPIAVTLNENFDLDVERFLSSEAKILYICSPNNPTGTPISRSAVEQIVKKATGVVVIDEAYAEFASESFEDLAKNHSNVIVARTFSKAFGLAGLRIGYAIGNPDIIAEVEKSRGPYKVNSIAEKAAVAAMTEDRPWVMERVKDAVSNRERLRSELEKMGLKPLPSQTNFVLVPIEQAADKEKKMREEGVAVRPFINLPHVGDALRISVGPWELMEDCLNSLKKIIS